MLPKNRRRLSWASSLGSMDKVFRISSISSEAQRGSETYLIAAWPGGCSSGSSRSLSTVCLLVKKYAKVAGLDPGLRVTMLQNTARQ